MKHLLAAVTMLAALGSPAMAQRQQHVKETSTQPSSDLFWVTGGIGAVGPGLGALAKLTYVWDQHSLSAKVQAGGKFHGSGSVSEWGLYYGRQQVDKFGIFRAAAGPALYTHSYPNFTNRLGLGAELEAMLKASPFGLSLMYSAMLTYKMIYHNLTLNLSIGKLAQF